jgi:hypothetical protein
MITLQFNDAKFQSSFSAIISRTKRPRALLGVAGREVANRLKAHFRDKDSSEPNRLSDRRTHFWLAVARSVQNPVVESDYTVSVSINDPRFAQKLFGGPIRAKLAGALTIPVEERAYGRSAKTFEAETGLTLILIRTGTGNFEHAILAVKEGKGLTVEYILTKSVNQQADTDALPDKTALEAAIIARANSVVINENQNN